MGCNDQTELTSGAPPGCINIRRNEMSEVSLVLENPRKMGAHYFKVPNGQKTSSKESGSVEVFEYGVSLYQFARRIDCETYELPVFDMLSGSMSGALGGYEEEWASFAPHHYRDSVRNKLRIPIRKDIERLMIVLRSEVEDTGWRVFEFDPHNLKTVELRIPDLMTLPIFCDRADHQHLSDLVAHYESMSEPIRLQCETADAANVQDVR